MNQKRLIVMAGPTAVGKTALALAVAEALHTEIVSADSRQIFKELRVGTAPPDAVQLARVKHHFIHSHSIDQPYDAGQYGRDALALIHQLFATYNDVVLCGGSGLYIKAVCEGFDDMPEIAPTLRGGVIKNYQEFGLAWLQEEVKKRDPVFFEQVDTQNPQRLMRALELLQATGLPINQLRKRSKHQHPFLVVKMGLELDRPLLYQRIDDRVDQMIANGLFEEAQALFTRRHLNALQTVGYQEIFDFIEGKYDRAEAIKLLKRNSRRYAKRQLTWFKRDPDFHWFNALPIDTQTEAILKFLQTPTTHGAHSS